MNKVSHVLSISLITNFMLSLFKVIIGFIGSSGALIADGIHSFSDLVTDLIGIIGSIFSKKPSDDKHPYGHGKIEYLISIFIGLVILSLGFVVIYNSLTRNTTVPSIIVIFVSFFTILAKLLLARYLIKQGQKLNSNILISSGKESNMDVISSIVVLISSILMQIDIPILRYSDIIAGLLVGVLVLKVGFEVLTENISTILGEQVTNDEYLKKVKQTILKYENIKEIDDLIILKYGPYHKLISKISINSDISIIQAHEMIDNLERDIKNDFEQIDYVNISIKPYNNSKNTI